MNKGKINGVIVIAFDADDTLWVNEPYYQEVEKSFCELLKNHLPTTEISKELLKIGFYYHFSGYRSKSP